MRSVLAHVALHISKAQLIKPFVAMDASLEERLQKAEADAGLLRITNDMLACRLRYFSREIELACCNAVVAEKYIPPKVFRQYRDEVTRLMNEIKTQHPHAQVPEEFVDCD